jgi:acyl-CoA synthetase (AMP-forming)/AMP-acid ligase II
MPGCRRAGRYEIAGRAKDLIITEGYNVHSRSEEAIITHAAIREAAVLGVPHPLLGEEIVACAVLRDDAGCSSDALMSHLIERWRATSSPAGCGSSRRCRETPPARSSGTASSGRSAPSATPIHPSEPEQAANNCGDKPY